MAKVDLARLKSAVETGNSDLYHGDVREGMLEALEELAESRDQLEEIKEVLGVTVPTS